MSAGTRQREAFFAAMERVAVGAQLARRKVAWTVTKSTSMETSQRLELRHGRRTQIVNVPVCITGPCLADVGLRHLAAAPTQRDLGLTVRSEA